MKPIKVKSDDGTFTIVSVHAPKGWPDGTIYLRLDEGRHVFLSPAEAVRLRNALVEAIVSVVGPGPKAPPPAPVRLPAAG